MATRKFKLTCPRCDGVGYIAERYEKQGDAIRDLSRAIFENEYLPSVFADDVLLENKCLTTDTLQRGFASHL